MSTLIYYLVVLALYLLIVMITYVALSLIFKPKYEYSIRQVDKNDVRLSAIIWPVTLIIAVFMGVTGLMDSLLECLDKLISKHSERKEGK